MQNPVDNDEQRHSASRALRSIRGFWRTLLQYLGARGERRSVRIVHRDLLREFLATRSSYVAQASLYGYLRTRAGVRFAELFHDETFVHALNGAKWQVWLACLSDLSVYAGGLLAHHARPAGAAGPLVLAVVEEVLARTGIPAEADADAFADHAQRVRARIALTEWTAVRDDESPFTESPIALVRWAPIVKMLMELDEAIVRNSVRFRWQEIRRELRHNLDPVATLASHSRPDGPSDAAESGERA